ncbi:hypothetical protein GCM10017687_80480 [Streptomyces echinatus]
MGEVGDDDRAAAVLGDLVEQPPERGTGRDERGEGGPHGLRQTDGGELAPHEPALDLLRQLGEGERPVQDDHGQPAPLGGPAHHLGRRREGAAESEHDGGGLARCRDWMYSACLALVPGEEHPGGEHHLAAAEHHADVGRLGDVHPAHGPVELPGSGDHLGVPGEDPRSRRSTWRTERTGSGGCRTGLRVSESDAMAVSLARTVLGGAPGRGAETARPATTDPADVRRRAPSRFSPRGA